MDRAPPPTWAENPRRRGQVRVPAPQMIEGSVSVTAAARKGRTDTLNGSSLSEGAVVKGLSEGSVVKGLSEGARVRATGPLSRLIRGQLPLAC